MPRTHTEAVIWQVPNTSFPASGTADSQSFNCGSLLIGCEPFRPLIDVRDSDGIERDTWYFLGAQFASLGVLYMLPESVSGWSDEQRDNYSLNKWKQNAGHPVVDEDKFYLNFVLHPYWGAAYYVRAQERGYNRWESFWYSTFLSTLYEFGPEALFEQPSIQDLIVTPVAGWLLGDYFMRLRASIRQRTMSRGSITTPDSWLWGLTDPLNAVNNGIDRLLGRESQFSVLPLLNYNFAFESGDSGTLRHPLLRQLMLRDKADFGIQVRVSF